MHQYKTVTQILLILSIFNLVFAIPVVQEIYDAHDMVAPIVVGNVTATSKERRDVSDSSPSHSSLPLPGGSPSDRPAPLHESPPPPPGGPAALEVSSPAGGTASLPVVPSSDQPAPTLSQYTAVTHDMLQLDPPPASESMLKKYGTVGTYFALDAAIAAIIIGGVIWHNHHKHHSRTIDPDRYVSSPSHLSRRCINVPNHKHLTYEIFLSPTAKGPRHPGL